MATADNQSSILRHADAHSRHAPAAGARRPRHQHHRGRDRGVLDAASQAIHVLFSNISARNRARSSTSLTSTAIPYQLDRKAARSWWPTQQVHQARLKLAEQGLPHELRLRRSRSCRMPAASPPASSWRAPATTTRWKPNWRGPSAACARAERARAPGRAEVHGVPRQEAANRAPRCSSSSTPDANWNESQVAAIVHLVASSIPDLQADQVTVVDQSGELLNAPGRQRLNSASAPGSSTTPSAVEDSYVARIENLLVPHARRRSHAHHRHRRTGFHRSARKPRKLYDPDKTVVRSEQVAEDRRTDDAAAARRHSRRAVATSRHRR